MRELMMRACSGGNQHLLKGPPTPLKLSLHGIAG